jgi:hypothetical protein
VNPQAAVDNLLTQRRAGYLGNDFPCIAYFLVSLEQLKRIKFSMIWDL